MISITRRRILTRTLAMGGALLAAPSIIRADTRGVIDGTDATGTIDADVCIIGSGFCGVAVAERLASTGARVVIAEAGGRDFDCAEQDALRARVSGLPTSDTDRSRARVVGGTSHLWGGGSWLPTPHDLSAEGWPEGLRREMDPWITRAAAFLDVPEVHDDLYADLNAMAAEADARYQPGIVHPLRVDGRLLSLVEAHENLTLLTGACATGFAIGAAGVEGVRLHTANGAVMVAARQVLLCGGGLESIRLMLNAQAEDARAGGNGGAHIGQEYTQHLAYECAQIEHFEGMERYGWAPFGDRQQYPVLVRETAPTGASMVFKFAVRNAEPELETWRRLRETRRPCATDGMMHVLGGALRDNTDLVRAFYRRALSQPDEKALAAYFYAEHDTRSGSSVTLTEERDASGLRRLDIDLRQSARDSETIAEALSWITAHFGAVHGAQAVPLIDTTPETMPAGSHQYGGLAMGDSADTSVVDRHGAVWGLRGLHLCSSATFPRATGASPTMLAVALAMRTAAQVAETL